MTKIKDIVDFFNQIAPFSYQEGYDNSGLLCGNPNHEVKNILCTLDCVEEIVEEAKEKKCELIVAHHPIVFKGLKSLTGKNYVERTMLKAIKNDIAILAVHTNLDHVHTGVNKKIADKLGLKNTRILAPKNDILMKLVTFVPDSHLDGVLQALHEAGAGNIGNYKNCSFSTSGVGRFEPNETANPYLGQKGKLEMVQEQRIEVIFPAPIQSKIMAALRKAHPYEEVAYYLQDLRNENQEVGAGMYGDLETELSQNEFLSYLKSSLNISVVRYTPIEKKIKRVAVCGGAGSFLLGKAKSVGADAFLTADFKYHEFFDAEKRIMISDIGHFESEEFTKELFCELLNKNFANIASHLSGLNTNPISYFY